MGTQLIQGMKESTTRYLLSICIPTYNRWEYLQNLLEGLLPQMQRFHDKVSLHITDNASTDNTIEIIKELSAKYEVDIDLYRQDENVGLDRNYDKASSMSDGKYTFILGDDDLLAPNFLKTILDYIDKDEEYSLVHFNWIHGDDVYNCQYVQNRNYVPATYMPVGDFFMQFTASPNFTSAVIFNTKLWTLGLPKEGEFDGGGYWGFARILKGACLFQKPCVYHHYPLVIQRNPVRSFQTMMLYYMYHDMSKIFQIGDAYIPGLFDRWTSFFLNAGYGWFECIAEDVSFYREHRDEMKEFLNNEQLKVYDKIINARNPQKTYTHWRYRRKLMGYLRKLRKLL